MDFSRHSSVNPMLPTVTHRAVRPSSQPTGWAHVQFFGKVADRFGRTREAPIPLGGCTLSQLMAALAREAPGGAEALAEPGLRMAVDQVLTTEDAWVLPGQGVAFFSVFSGG
ncbi:MAG TPA: MoaD/ThiS family protein [Phenylobacterium sp.]|nr:MoaD/ThiS family protein [Phenylobacterium sp.]